MLKDDDIKRTVCGVIPTFAEIFTGARYARKLYSDAKSGTAHDIRKGELFISTDARQIEALPESFGPGFNSILVATPNENFMKPRFSPRIASRGVWQSVPPACVRILQWKAAGHYLILAGDPNHICDEWWGFVPFGQTFEVEG